MDFRSLIPPDRDLPSSRFRQILDSLLNLVFPQSCLVCAVPIARYQERGVCDRCWGRVLALRITRPWCPCCGVPFQWGESDSLHLCAKCSLELPPYSAARSFGYYSSELRRIIHALKFHGCQNLAELLSFPLVLTLLDSWKREEFDLVIPVPLHPKRKRERGFNQASLLGRALGRLLALPYCENALSRIRHTVPQVGLTDRDRLLNLRKAFRCDTTAVVGRKVLLVDDVMTTGSTVESASRALCEGGVHRVAVLTVARAVPGLDL